LIMIGFMENVFSKIIFEIKHKIKLEYFENTRLNFLFFYESSFRVYIID
jgi:hypothetical protein